MYNQARIRFTEAQLIKNDEILLTSHSYQDTIDKLRGWGIQQQSFYCKNELCDGFNVEMKWIQDQSRMEFGRFRCGSCDAKRSVRHDSKFYNLKTDLIKLFRIVFHSFINMDNYTKIANDLHLERHTVARIIKLVRSTISDYYQTIVKDQEPVEVQATEEYDLSNEQRPIRYYSPAVEADETLITHINGIDNLHQAQCWVIGVVERGTQEFRLKAIGINRNKQQFEQFFRDFVSTNPRINYRKTRVFKDGHPSYGGLPRLGYTHITVVHDRGFEEGINTTNHIKSLWAQVKGYNLFNRGQRYSDIEEVQKTLDKISWRLRCQRQQLSLIHELANIIRQQYQQN